MSNFSVSSQVSICLNIVLIDILPLNAGALLVIEGLNFFFFKLFYFKYLVGRTESQLPRAGSLIFTAVSLVSACEILVAVLGV